jgi:hypothetical protein
MHYSGLFDIRAIQLHPDWAQVNADGQRSERYICMTSDYDRELLIPQMLEIIDKYDVDGFWVDGECWAANPCWCERCQKQFMEATGFDAIPRTENEPHWREWLDFHRQLFFDHVQHYAHAVHQRKPDCLVCSNWMYTLRQPEPIEVSVDYLSGDSPYIWGCDAASVEGRFLDSRGMSWDLGVWAFIRSGAELRPLAEHPGMMTPWVMKPLPHICQEASILLSLGGAVLVYDQPQRTGWITGWHQEIIADVADFCRERKDACFQTKSASEIGVLSLREHYYAHHHSLFNPGHALLPAEGALHSLLENQHSVDMLDPDAWETREGQYRLLVVPEQTLWPEGLELNVRQFAEQGGWILLSGDDLVETYSDLVGAQDAGPFESSPASLAVDNKAVPLNGDWRCVQPNEGTEIWDTLLSEQEVEKDRTSHPAVTCRPLGKGGVVAVHGPIFQNYALGHYPLLRTYIRQLLQRLPIDWRMKVEGPPSLEVVLRRKDDNLRINLINRNCRETLNLNRTIVEDIPPIQDIRLRVQSEAKPAAVTIIPAKTSMEWSYAEGVIEIDVPTLDIHAVICIEN